MNAMKTKSRIKYSPRNVKHKNERERRKELQDEFYLFNNSPRMWHLYKNSFSRFLWDIVTLNIPISECGKLVKVILNSLCYELVPPKDLGSIVHLGIMHLKYQHLALFMCALP